MPLTALFLFVPIVLANRIPLDLPPHCSSEGLMESEMRTFGSNFSSVENANEIWWSTHLKMSLNDTACFFIKQNKTGSSTILHTLRYSRLEHRYSIAEKYTFGVPEIHQSCKCDCPGGETICSVNDYQYRNCTNGTLCYRTHRPFQSSSGCITSGQSELCCEIRIEPYKNMEFKAVKLKQPDTFVVLHYRIFIRQNGKWKRDFEDKSVRIPLNTGSAKVEQNSHSIHFIVGSGRPHRQVEPGMYFWDARNKQLHGNVQLNDPQEKSLDKLGWFRLENNQWTVQQGLEKITHAQHVSVENCKAQRYRFSFTAEQFVLMPTNEDSKNEPNSYNLGTLISNEKWVQSVELGERFVIINHGEGSELSLHVKTKTQLGLVHPSVRVF
ncbi:hypothetical protein M3Y97_00044600 [Aphelenchoides bicaudatus]|nr:hypothetical protein M3Y97_00044600 [Aphelenchoides bicaudatus]